MSYAKPCKYNCGTQIVWDKFANQFKDNQTGEPHTREVCESIRNQKGNQIQDQRIYKVTSPQQQIPISTNNPAFEKAPTIQSSDVEVTYRALTAKIDNLNIAIAKVMSMMETMGRDIIVLTNQAQNSPTIRDNMKLKQKITELEAAYEQIEGKSFVPANQVKVEDETEESLIEHITEEEEQHDEHVREMVRKGREEEELDLT